MNIIISGLHLKKFPGIEKYAREKVTKLTKFHANIEEISVRLIWEKSHRDINQDYTCEITVSIPGKNLGIKDTESSMDKAIDFAVERMKRLLVKSKEKHVSRQHKSGLLNKIRNRLKF